VYGMRSSLALVAALALSSPALAQAGTVLSQVKIAPQSGGFGGGLDSFDHFGIGLAALGDLDGDGFGDLAVGATGDDDGGQDQGAVWVLRLDSIGQVLARTKVREGGGGFGGDLAPGDGFGAALARLGDLDGDGVTDLAVGAPGDDGAGTSSGAVWLLFLNSDGSVKSERRLGADALAGETGDQLGSALAGLGDLDGDGTFELAVGAPGDDDGSTNLGAIWILSLDPAGTLVAQRKISATAGGFAGNLQGHALLGSALSALGDLDGDGTVDLAVGAPGSPFVANNPVTWILFLNPDGTVRTEQELPVVDSAALAATGDLDGDGHTELAVGNRNDEDGGGPDLKAEGCEGPFMLGSVTILFLDADGTVKHTQKISETQGNLGEVIGCHAHFGSAVAGLGDQDGDGRPDLAVGAPEERRMFSLLGTGAVWVLLLDGEPPPCVTLGFQTGGDGATLLPNGLPLAGQLLPLVTLTSSGPNAGAAVFDSTPGGPNDPSQDTDLLVDTGNVAILQTENLPPDGSGVFPLPNDDSDGGTLRFDFPAPVEPRSLRLVDIDATDPESRVVLTDEAGRTRTFVVPSNWTGDRNLAQPGVGTLDLESLAPQPGFGSVVSASEQPGFDPAAVVRLELVLGGSGALDDLSWCPPGTDRPRAAAHVRNGSGLNTLSLTSPARPVLGGHWVARLDCAGAPGLALLLLAPRATTVPASGGELLIAGPRLVRLARAHAGVPVHFTVPIPARLSLLGRSACAQGVNLSGAVRLSNALDLVLGQ